jgi:hypothetical protein
MNTLTWQDAENRLGCPIPRTRAWRCNSLRCRCKSAYMLHCPGCGELYLYSGHDYDPCVDCEGRSDLDPERFGPIVGVWRGRDYGVVISLDEEESIWP